MVFFSFLYPHAWCLVRLCLVSSWPLLWDSFMQYLDTTVDLLPNLCLIVAPHWSSRCTCILSYLGWLLTFVLSEMVCPSSQISFPFFLSFQGFLYSFKKHLTPSIARCRFHSIFASFVQIFLLFWEIFYGVFIWMYPGFRISHCKGRRMWGWALEGKGVEWAPMTEEGECSRELKVIIWLWVWRWNSGRLSWEGIDCQIDGNLKIWGVLIIRRGFRKNLLDVIRGWVRRAD